jgi:hypothetical protein
LVKCKIAPARHPFAVSLNFAAANLIQNGDNVLKVSRETARNILVLVAFSITDSRAFKDFDPVIQIGKDFIDVEKAGRQLFSRQRLNFGGNCGHKKTSCD